MAEKLMLSDVRVGDVLVTDGGFTCMDAGVQAEVHEDEIGLWIGCGCGRHHLDGQTAFDEADRLVGLRRLEP